MKQIIIFLILLLELLAEKKYDLNLKNDYHLVPEWFEVVSYDKRYVKEMVATVFKPRRTLTAFNITFIFNVCFGNDLQFVLQTYKFASNEYREFPMRMQVNACEAIEQDAGGLGKTLKCGNFTGCPILKGRKYHTCNWTPDESKLPPYIPSGRYMIEIQGLYNSSEMYVWRLYFAITRPEV